MIEHQYKHRILYADTDAMGVVYYANYLRIYEAARADFLDKIDTPLCKIIENNIINPVIKVNIEYILPALFDWEVIVKTRVDTLPMAKFVFHHELYSPDNVLLNKATLSLAFVDKTTFKAVRCPQWILDNVQKYI